MPTKLVSEPVPHVPYLCLPDLLEHQSKRLSEATALLAPNQNPLTYGRLYQRIRETKRGLRSMGIAPRDRVAVVLPNGREMAVAVIAVAVSAACAPMNPAYGFEEFFRYFSYLRPRALITEAGIDS